MEKNENKKEIRKPIKSKSDIEILREKNYRENNSYNHKNICDIHEDGA